MTAHGKHKAAGTLALDLLRGEHQRVRNLFGEFDSLKGLDDEDERKAELVDEICYELTLHTMIEEEIFYPVLRSAIGDDDLMDEADVEHAGARELISQLEVMYPGDDHFDATVAVLGEEVGHHMDKEEGEMFDAARRAGIDFERLGEQLAARRAELEEDLSSPAGTIDAMEPHEGARRARRPPD
ncbi:hemerythrin domain-containing protein [Massilia solisilvae]|uniref:Hemerythrin domain-containing protein n=1 Tax=Massilia solisilvae TaxID=1811225 RepID=A0ABT2BKB5_9BURK|nr:hemerythrin domain-containing protein [Massilia solisilvae]MCS0608944.1 hemerythrin domain-containing protein [Massilia solisilvae]